MIKIAPRLVPVRFESRVPIGLRGCIHVAKVARDGRRLPVRVDRNKRAFQRVWDHVQDNLITNGGLDFGMGGTESATIREAVLRFNLLTWYVHVGTDNTAPTTSDSALGGEVARTNATLDMGAEEEVILPEDGVGVFRRVRTFDYEEANGNLAEFGGGADDTTTVLTRGLFEDEGGNPTPITKTSDELLVVTYDLISNVSPISMNSAGTVDVVGYDEFDISGMVHVSMAGNTDVNNWWFGLWRSNPSIFPVTANTDTYGATVVGNLPTGVGPVGVGGAEDYIGGSYERIITGTYGPQSSGATLTGYQLRGQTGTTNRLLASFRFDSPSTLEKDRDYRVTFSAKITVSRS